MYTSRKGKMSSPETHINNKLLNMALSGTRLVDRQQMILSLCNAELTQEVWGRGPGSLLALLWILWLCRRSVELLGRLKVEGRRRLLVNAVSSTSARRSVSSPSLISSSVTMELSVQVQFHTMSLLKSPPLLPGILCFLMVTSY